MRLSSLNTKFIDVASLFRRVDSDANTNIIPIQTHSINGGDTTQFTSHTTATVVQSTKSLGDTTERYVRQRQRQSTFFAFGGECAKNDLSSTADGYPTPLKCGFQFNGKYAKTA